MPGIRTKPRPADAGFGPGRVSLAGVWGPGRHGQWRRGRAILSAMQPLGIHHASINVDDSEAGIAFYTEILGGTVRDDRPDFGIGGAWIDLGVSQVHLIELEVPPDRGQHFAIQVADLDATVAELRVKGVDVNDPSAAGSGRQTFVTDPAGNTVELHEVAAG
jgi:glyoxylase I family protein